MTREETTDETREVHDILERIAGEGELARIDARLDELAGEVERAAAEAERAQGANRRELELMRVRVEDALSYVGDSTAAQREAWEQTSTRLDEVARNLGGELARALDAVREGARGERDRAQASSEELELSVRAEIERTRADVAELATRSRTDLTQLRTELDGSVGELRAGQNLAAQRFEELLDHVRAALQTAVGEVQDRMAEREREVSEGLETLGAQLRSTAQRLGEAIDREREARGTGQRRVTEEIDGVRGRLEEVDGRASSLAGRQDVELGRLQGLLTELTGRVEALAAGHSPEERPDGDAVTALSARLDDLAERIQRTESIARESGRLLLNLLRQRHDEVATSEPHAGLEERAEL